MVAGAVERDHVQGVVLLPIPASVQSVTLLTATRGVDRARAGERGEGGLAAHAARRPARDEQLRGAHRADALLPQELRCEGIHERAQLGVELGDLLRERARTSPEPAQDGDESRPSGPATQSARPLGQPLSVQALEPGAQVARRDEDDGTQLVEGAGPRPLRAPSLEQEQAQLLTLATAAQLGQPLARTESA